MLEMDPNAFIQLKMIIYARCEPKKKKRQYVRVKVIIIIMIFVHPESKSSLN